MIKIGRFEISEIHVKGISLQKVYDNFGFDEKKENKRNRDLLKSAWKIANPNGVKEPKEESKEK